MVRRNYVLLLASKIDRLSVLPFVTKHHTTLLKADDVHFKKDDADPSQKAFWYLVNTDAPSLFGHSLAIP